MQRARLFALAFIAGVGTAFACSSSPRYPACDHDSQCASGGRHDYCVASRCVYCRTAADCDERQRCSAGRCEADPNAPPLADAGSDAEPDADGEAGTGEDEAPPESPRHVLPPGVRRYLRP